MECMFLHDCFFLRFSLGLGVLLQSGLLFCSFFFIDDFTIPLFCGFRRAGFLLLRVMVVKSGVFWFGLFLIAWNG